MCHYNQTNNLLTDRCINLCQRNMAKTFSMPEHCALYFMALDSKWNLVWMAFNKHWNNKNYFTFDSNMWTMIFKRITLNRRRINREACEVKASGGTIEGRQIRKNYLLGFFHGADGAAELVSDKNELMTFF